MEKKSFVTAYSKILPKKRDELMHSIAKRMNISLRTLLVKRTGLLGMTEDQIKIVREEFEKAGIKRVFDCEYSSVEKKKTKGAYRPFTVQFNSLMDDEKEELYNRINEMTPMSRITFYDKRRGYKTISCEQIHAIKDAFRDLYGIEHAFNDELTKEEKNACKRRNYSVRKQYAYRCAYKMMTPEQRKEMMAELVERSGISIRSLEFKRNGRINMSDEQADDVRAVYLKITGSEIVFDRFQKESVLEVFGTEDNEPRMSCPFCASFAELDKEARARVKKRISEALNQSPNTLQGEKSGAHRITATQKEIIRKIIQDEGIELVFDEERGVKHHTCEELKNEQRNKFRKLLTKDGLYGYYPMPVGYNHALGYSDLGARETKSAVNSVSIGKLDD